MASFFTDVTNIWKGNFDDLGPDPPPIIQSVGERKEDKQDISDVSAPPKIPPPPPPPPKATNAPQRPKKAQKVRESSPASPPVLPVEAPPAPRVVSPPPKAAVPNGPVPPPKLSPRLSRPRPVQKPPGPDIVEVPSSPDLAPKVQRDRQPRVRAPRPAKQTPEAIEARRLRMITKNEKRNARRQPPPLPLEPQAHLQRRFSPETAPRIGVRQPRRDYGMSYAQLVKTQHNPPPIYGPKGDPTPPESVPMRISYLDPPAWAKDILRPTEFFEPYNSHQWMCASLGEFLQKLDLVLHNREMLRSSISTYTNQHHQLFPLTYKILQTLMAQLEKLTHSKVLFSFTTIPDLKQPSFHRAYFEINSSEFPRIGPHYHTYQVSSDGRAKIEIFDRILFELTGQFRAFRTAVRDKQLGISASWGDDEGNSGFVSSESIVVSDVLSRNNTKAPKLMAYLKANGLHMKISGDAFSTTLTSEHATIPYIFPIGNTDKGIALAGVAHYLHSLPAAKRAFDLWIQPIIRATAAAREHKLRQIEMRKATKAEVKQTKGNWAGRNQQREGGFDRDTHRRDDYPSYGDIADSEWHSYEGSAAESRAIFQNERRKTLIHNSELTPAERKDGWETKI